MGITQSVEENGNGTDAITVNDNTEDAFQRSEKEEEEQYDFIRHSIDEIMRMEEEEEEDDDSNESNEKKEENPSNTEIEMAASRRSLYDDFPTSIEIGIKERKRWRQKKELLSQYIVNIKRNNRFMPHLYLAAKAATNTSTSPTPSRVSVDPVSSDSYLPSSPVQQKEDDVVSKIAPLQHLCVYYIFDNLPFYVQFFERYQRFANHILKPILYSSKRLVPPTNPNIVTVRITEDKIIANDYSTFAVNHKPTSLIISYEGMQDDEFCQCIQHQKNVVSINIRGCVQLTDNVLPAIGDACHSNLLQVNFMGSEHIHSGYAFNELTTKCKFIRKLLLSSCRYLQDDALAVIGTNLRCLQILDLTHCEVITDHGLIPMIENSHFLLTLKLRNCGENISNKTLEALAKHCPLLQELDLCFCPHISNRGISELASGCLFIRVLMLRGCNISADGMETIATKCQRIQMIDVQEIEDIPLSCFYLFLAYAKELISYSSAVMSVSDLTPTKTKLLLDSYDKSKLKKLQKQV